MVKRVLLDTNLLVLFIVGGTRREYVRLHKNCSGFRVEDYDRLLLHVSLAAGLMTTTHILAETSNLVRQVKDPVRSEISTFFKLFIRHAAELRPDSAQAADDEAFYWLGLNDVSILRSLGADRVLITEDSHLYAAALGRSSNVLHFSQLTVPI